MGDKNLFIVTQALQEVKYIRSLNVSKNKISCIGAKAIGNLLVACADKLQVLLVHYNQIMGKGGREIAAGVKVSNSL
jgi:hypothetical protein